MHRMRHFLVMMGLGLAAGHLGGGRAAADLLRPTAGLSYPDIVADHNSQLTYTFDPAAKVGSLHLENFPLQLASGPKDSDEIAIGSTAAGLQQQVLNIALDPNGQVIPGAGNSYSLYGTIDAGGQKFTGLLLQGVPTGFGSLDLGKLLPNSDVFDVNLSITGGVLKDYFGSNAYMRIMPEASSTFTGSFVQDFSASKVITNTRTYDAPHPFPIPEPATLAVLLAGGLGLALRRRRGRFAIGQG